MKKRNELDWKRGDQEQSDAKTAELTKHSSGEQDQVFGKFQKSRKYLLVERGEADGGQSDPLVEQIKGLAKATASILLREQQQAAGPSLQKRAEGSDFQHSNDFSENDEEEAEGAVELQRQQEPQSADRVPPPTNKQRDKCEVAQCEIPRRAQDHAELHGTVHA